MRLLILLAFLLSSCSTSRAVHSDFENGMIGKMWKTKLLTPNNWKIQNKKASSGNYALRLTLKKGMKEGLGGENQTTERIEIKEKSRYHAHLEEKHRYKFSFYIPKNFPKTKKRLVIGQWKQQGDRSPVIAQRYVNGIFYVTISNAKGKETILRLSKEESKSLLGRWIDVDYKVRFSQNGYVFVKIDQYKSQYKGALFYPGDAENIYFKFGLYRDQIEKPMTIYFDNYRHIYE
jgi:hypothetical protein